MLSASAALHAQSQAAVSYPVPDLVLELWPDGAPTDNGLSGDEIDYGNHVSNVTEPTLSLFLPEGECNGLAIISCPGGGYIDVWDKTEGYSLADWYNEMGIVYAVLKYRLPNGHREVPLDDVQKAMRMMASGPPSTASSGSACKAIPPEVTLPRWPPPIMWMPRRVLTLRCSSIP